MPPAKPIVSDLGAPPSLDWIPLERLVVDKRYQRALGVKNERHVRRISSGFRWNRYQPIVVTEAGDNFAVIDGQHRLAAARLQARHELIVGTRAVSVSTGSGKSVTYTATDLGKLDAYIASLRVQLGQSSGYGRPFVPTF